MKNIIINILLLISLTAYSQNKNIKLPKEYGFDIMFNDTSITPIYSIYMNKMGEVSFEGVNLPLEKLNDTVTKYLFKFPSKILNTRANIYADKRIPYHQIEDIKEEITKGSLFKIVYITDDFDDNKNGIPFRLHRTSINNKNVKEKKSKMK